MLDKLSLGTVQFGLDYGISNRGGVTSISEVKKIIYCARREGIKLIDTAYAYGNSEVVLGKVGIEDFKVVSKFFITTPETIIEDQIKSSLHNLRISRLYGLLAHRALDVINNPGIWDFLTQLKLQKIVEKIGFSFNAPDEIEKVLMLGYKPDIIQVPFNYLDRRFVPYMIDLKSKGCEIHSRSAFLQGLFFLDPDNLDGFFKEVQEPIKYLQSFGPELPGLLLKFCLGMDFIDQVIFGVNNRKQLETNIKTINTNRTMEDMSYKISEEILTPYKWPKLK